MEKDKERDVLEKERYWSITQVYTLCKPLLSHNQKVVHLSPSITCDSGFASVPLAAFGIENDFHIIGNVKNLSESIPKEFFNALTVHNNQYITLQTTQQYTSNHTTAQIQKPVYLTISNAHAKSMTVHTFPSNQTTNYIIKTKSNDLDGNGHYIWKESIIPSAPAFYLRTYSANDQHNRDRVLSHIENLWPSPLFKVRVFELFLNWVWCNTHQLWISLCHRYGLTPTRDTFCTRMKQGFHYIRE